MKVDFHPEAEHELNEYANFYESEIAGLGIRFVEEARRIASLIADHPNVGQEIEKEFRHCVFVSFPHSYIYQIESDRIWILAVAHHRRRPGLWRER